MNNRTGVLHGEVGCRVELGGVRPRQRIGLSLLEVVLALAILAVSSAYLARSMQLATSNALKAQRLTQAELVAESVMNQVIAGVIPSEPTSWTNYVNSYGATDWMYQLQQVPTEVEGMVGLQVAVQKNDPATGIVQANFDLYANRWIIDPALMLDVPAAEDEAAGYGGESFGGGSSSGMSGGGMSGGGMSAGGGSAGSSGGAGYAGGAFGGFGGGFGAGGPRGGSGGGPRGGRADGSGRAGGNAQGRGSAGGRGGGGRSPGGSSAGGRGFGPGGPAASGRSGGGGPRSGGTGFGPGGFGPGGPGGGRGGR